MVRIAGRPVGRPADQASTELSRLKTVIVYVETRGSVATLV